MASFIGTCVGNPFGNPDRLCEIIDNGRPITKRTFFKNCDLEDKIKKEMRLFPHDFEFFKSGRIYFYTWSCIEHFYQ